MSIIWLPKFPLPPSANEFLMPIAGKSSHGIPGTSRMVKTKVHRDYLESCVLWTGLNRQKFTQVQQWVESHKDAPLVFRVDAYFVFEYSRLFAKDGAIKRLDRDNRLKPLGDGLAHILGIDDSRFFAGDCEKVYTGRKELECTMLRLSAARPRTLEQVMTQMERERTIAGSSS